MCLLLSYDGCQICVPESPLSRTSGYFTFDLYSNVLHLSYKFDCFCDCLIGFLWYVDLDFNTVTAINMVVAVGIAVDYSAHIAHSFLVMKGSRKDRAHAALQHIGGEVIAGAFTTWLAISVMVAAEHFIFKTFFKMFFAIVVVGVWHGLIILPIMLSICGPEPYASG